MHTRNISLFLIVTFVIVVSLLSTLSQPTEGKAQSKKVTPNYGYAQGAAAITPHIKGNGSNTTSSPTFTEEDVRQFIAQNGMPNGIKTTTGLPPTVSQVLFSTAKQVSSLMKTSISRPDNALVCYVVVRGPFIVNLSMPAGTDQQENTSSSTTSNSPAIIKVEMVFDGYTGNLLLFRIPPPSQQS